MTTSATSKTAGHILFALQIIQFQIASAIVAIAAYRLLGTNIRTQRIETMVLGVSAKSLIIIAYEVLTSHIDLFRRFASLKANATLTALELFFWPVAVGIVAYSRIRWGCPAGLGCTLASIILALSAVMTVLAPYPFEVALQRFRLFKNHGIRPEEDAQVDVEQLGLKGRAGSGLSEAE